MEITINTKSTCFHKWMWPVYIWVYAFHGILNFIKEIPNFIKEIPSLDMRVRDPDYRALFAALGTVFGALALVVSIVTFCLGIYLAGVITGLISWFLMGFGLQFWD